MRMIRTEKQVESLVKKELKTYTNAIYNIHGTGMGSGDGTPDLFVPDPNGQFMGVELKAPQGKPYPNQLRRGLEIIQSQGRYIVAYADFKASNLTNGAIPKIEYESEEMKCPKHTFELVVGETHG